MLFTNFSQYEQNILDSKRNDECIDFIMMCVCVCVCVCVCFLSVITF